MTLLLIIGMLWPTTTLSAQETQAMQTVTFPAMDGITITADLYETGDRTDPVVVLFHQSISSRGEYRSIAPRIAEGKRNVIAVDLRWGGTDKWHNVVNQTAIESGNDQIVKAEATGDRSKVWPTIFMAYNDMLSSLDWLAGNDFTGPVVVVGSSFSAMMQLKLPSERNIDGLVAFSPGEYHDSDSLLARRWASEIEIPTLLIGGQDECDLLSPIFASLEAPVKSILITEESGHGASMLNSSEEAWTVLETFLEAYDKPEAVSFNTADGVKIYGDWYDGVDVDNDPNRIALLLHQGGSNARAEYALTTPILRMHNFDVLAIDLRRGGNRFGGSNRTVEALEALEAAMPTYCEAFQDLLGSLDFLDSRGRSEPVVVFGSSFSATLAIQLAAARPDRVSLAVAFSPAAGAPMDGCQPHDFVNDLQVPVLALRPSQELHYGTVNDQLIALGESGVQTHVASNGVHGSSMLNPRRVTGSVNPNWQVVLSFLTEIR